MTPTEMAIELSKCEYKNWLIVLKEDRGRQYIQVVFEAPDKTTGKMDMQRSRKWWLSEHMTRTELVQTAFLAILKAEEHEVRENFTYRDRTIFNSHIDVDKLWMITDQVDVRSTLSLETKSSQISACVDAKKPDLLPSVENAITQSHIS